MAVSFFIAHNKGFKLHAQPQTGHILVHWSRGGGGGSKSFYGRECLNWPIFGRRLAINQYFWFWYWFWVTPQKIILEVFGALPKIKILNQKSSLLILNYWRKKLGENRKNLEEVRKTVSKLLNIANLQLRYLRFIVILTVFGCQIHILTPISL